MLIPCGIVGFLIFLMFFELGIDYRVEARDRGAVPLDGPAFLRLLSGVADAEVHRGSRIVPFTRAAEFYDAQIEAIAAARASVHLEQFIFRADDVGRRFLDALVERARAGVKVRLVLDWAGSFTTPDRFFAPLRDAGGRVVWYQPPRWYTFKYLTNRTHRKILVVDGEVGFVGGAGIGEAWLHGEKKDPPWRDTVFRVEGPLVAGLQTTFSENWLESSGEILFSPEYYEAGAEADREDAPAGLVVASSPQAGRSTRAHVTYQVLTASARRSIDISTPYLIPDKAMERALAEALERGVRVRILSCGPRTDHPLARISARGRYGQLLRRGAKVFEYRPAFLHTKSFVVDELWSIVGSANLDNRSFGRDDEVFLAVRDAGLARAIIAEFEGDLAASSRVDLRDWSRRSIFEKALAPAARVFDRQT